MDIAIRGRNLEVPEPMRAVVAEKVTRAVRMLEGMERAEVHLIEQRNPRIADKEVCEVTVTGPGRSVRARATGPDVTTAVDRVVDKLTHRMEKVKGKLVGRSHPRRNGSLDSSPVGARED
ncbi:MAG: ribosome-associated translation inhibitor RaiA [Actinomycetota bacterium]|nr:ribosome-associated translation inhibitor RaiA [Actinomycetota bacterium]